MTRLSEQKNKAKVYAENQALYLYKEACKQNFLRQFVRMLKQEKNDLLELQSVLAAGVRQQRLEKVRQMVSLAQIRGSVNKGRTYDFDGQFRPKNERTKSRWVSLAAAYSSGKSLPPVRLIKISGISALEDIYFVEDGHHRVSLAYALCEEHIDAYVTILHVVAGTA